jgi:NitT/TauT family transport system substrate-binding protein
VPPIPYSLSTSEAVDRRGFLRILGVGAAGLAGAALLGCGSQGGSESSSPPASKAAIPAATPPAGPPEQKTLRIGHLPITDASPLLIAHANDIYKQYGLEPERPTLFRAWNQIAEAFQARQVDVVHLLMPMAISLKFGQNVPLKIVAWNHEGGSALTVRNEINSVADLSGKTVAIPFPHSIHNIVLQMLLRDANLKPIVTGDPVAGSVKLVVMNPPDMPPALAQGSIQGFIVADPFNAVAEVNKVGKILRFVPDVWYRHACCVVVMHEDDVKNKPNWAQSVITSVAQAQVFARENRVEAARLLSADGGNYLPQPRAAIERALTHYDVNEYGPNGTGAIKHADWGSQRIDFEPFPYPTYTAELVRAMKETIIDGDQSFLNNLDPAAAHAQVVDDRFARAAIAAVGGAAKFGIDASLTSASR